MEAIEGHEGAIGRGQEREIVDVDDRQPASREDRGEELVALPQLARSNGPDSYSAPAGVTV
jgi:hypothetical protein